MKKKKRKYYPPLSRSNLSEQENLQSHYDPNGSWTGVPIDGEPRVPDGEKLIQDADDL